MKRVFFLLTVLMLTVTGSNLAFAADSDTNEETHTLILRRINDPSEFYDYYWEVETEPGQIEEGMNIMGRGTIPLDRFDEEDTLFAFADKAINMDFLDGRFGLTKELLLSDDFESIEITYTFDDVLKYSKYTNQELKLSVREYEINTETESEKEETHTLTLRRIDDPTEYHDYYWEVETEPGQIEEGMNIMGVGTIPLDRFDEEDTLFVIPDKDIKMNFLDGRFGLTKELLLSDDFESIEITYTFDDVLEYSRYMNQELELSVREDETEKEKEETHMLTLRRIDMPKSGYDYYFEVETEQGQIEEGMNLVGLVDVKLDFFDEIDTLFAFDLDDIDMEFLDGRYGITSELLSSDDFESMEITYTLDDVLAYGKYKRQKLGLTSEDIENEKAAEENINKSETEIYDSQEKFDSITKILVVISPIITHII